jgi:diguanylate cyclase (GGDEF)-like protein
MVAGPRVLLVEADDGVADHVKALIAELDPSARVVRAPAVEEAIAMTDGVPGLDAVVIAAELPDGSGLRVAQWALGIPDPPPIVVLADGERAELWESAVRSGVSVLLPRESLTAERLRGGLTLARDRARSERLGRLITDTALALESDDRFGHEVGAMLAELVAATGAEGVRLSVGVHGRASERWSRGDVDHPGSAALTLAGRAGETLALIELFDRYNQTWTGLRAPLTTLCDVVAASVLRRESVRQVRASEARLRALAENVPDAIVSVDASDVVAAANQRFALAVGHDHPVGVDLGHLISPGGLAELAARAVDESRRTGCAVSLPDEAVVVEGTIERWYGAKATRDDAGTVHVVLPDTTDRVLSERRLTELALTDHLTGLANRRLAIDRLQHALDRVGRGEPHLVVSLCDIDHFKATNDLFGHGAGDAVLIALSDRLRTAVRSADTAARLGGDEFLVISEAVGGPQAAEVVVERLHRRLCGPVEVGGEQLQLSVSLGYLIVSEPGRSADDILRLADLALYAAKAGGRGRYASFSPPADAASEGELVAELERAWADGRFVLRWAPIAGLDGKVRAARAMLWWIDEDGTERDPDELVAALPNGPLFGRVRRWVLAEALRARAQWVLDGTVDEDFRVHLRVFGRQLADAELPGDVLAELEATGTPGPVVALDVDEQAIGSSPGATERLEELAAAGLLVYLDRFGAAPVALDRLVTGPLAGLRLDAELVRDVWRRGDAAAMVDCLLVLAATAGLDVIVDGVDHAEQLQWLAGRRPVAVAGPLVGDPMAFEPLVARLATSRP